eukprot:GHVP01026343.1.p1 GENE.GHVP01026343.1~~GHVP01026343.1.p1  ORF type:complete len:340 (-),score=48.30 GHVP01026343.1:152-1171(-)
MTSTSRSATQVTLPNRVGLFYTIKEQIGKGSFGVIHKAESYKEPFLFAIKFEKKSDSSSQLRTEYKVYKILNGLEAIPKVYYFGQEGDWNVLVMDLLGKNIEELFRDHVKCFSIPTVCELAVRMLSIIESIHVRGLIYRDIKPDNFVFDKEKKVLHLIDFGMVKYYWDRKRNCHIPFRDTRPLTGTARYMSINSHKGCDQSRRDDLESLGNVFGYLFQGRLPWQDVKAENATKKYNEIARRKEETPTEEAFSGCPTIMFEYMKYVRGLGYTERPNYKYLIGLFSKILEGYTKQERIFDWHKKNETENLTSIEGRDDNEIISSSKKMSRWKPWNLCNGCK